MLSDFGSVETITGSNDNELHGQEERNESGDTLTEVAESAKAVASDMKEELLELGQHQIQEATIDGIQVIGPESAERFEGEVEEIHKAADEAFKDLKRDIDVTVGKEASPLY